MSCNLFSASKKRGIQGLQENPIKPATHVVRKEETLSKIASLYGTDYQSIAKANGLNNPNNIYIGQRLNIPDAKQTPIPPKKLQPKPPSTKKPIPDDMGIDSKGSGCEFIIVLDPGHGGTEKIGNSSANNAVAVSGKLEKDLVFDLAQRIKQKLNSQRVGKYKVKVLLTRNSDVNKSLAYRRGFANSKKAKLYLSLHFNGFFKPSTRGVEIFIADESSRKFAEIIVESAHRTINKSYSTPLRSSGTKGVKYARFGAIRNVNCPSALLEGEFITNQKASDYFSNSENMQSFAEGISRGLLKSIKQLYKVAK